MVTHPHPLDVLEPLLKAERLRGANEKRPRRLGDEHQCSSVSQNICEDARVLCVLPDEAAACQVWLVCAGIVASITENSSFHFDDTEMDLA